MRSLAHRRRAGAAGAALRLVTEPRCRRRPTRRIFRRSSAAAIWRSSATARPAIPHPEAADQFAGGRPIETPFGKLLAANITPDRETGIGAWTDDEFVGSLLKGTGRGGEHLYPAMPYTYFTRMTRDDALAIRAYLNTIPPVRNRVVSNQLPFPFNIRASMMRLERAVFQAGQVSATCRTRPRSGTAAPIWSRVPMHCGMCHTPKNLLGGDKTSDALQGYALQGWFAPNITNDSVPRARRLERRRHRRLPEDRAHRTGRGLRADGRGSGAFQFAA